LAYLEGGEPFIFEKPDAQAAVVCVHGLNATSYEVRPIGEALFQAGFHVEGPLVAGHGIAPREVGIREFHHSTREQWIESIRAILVRLKESFPRVFIVGQSMGGALAFYLASEGLPDAIATTGAALHLPRPAEWFYLITRHMNTILRHNDTRPFHNVSYGVLSSKAGAQIYLLAKETRARLNLIQCPVLAIFSQIDDTVQPRKLVKLLQKRMTAPLEIAWFNKSCHTMPLDVEGPAIAQKIVEFFTQQLG
jgi:carboxylesterase